VYGVAGGLGDVDTDDSRPQDTQEKLSENMVTNENHEGIHQANCSNQNQYEGKAHAEALSREFLRMTSYGMAGRLFTYVITLDGEWRFSQTGEEFTVDLLTKHSMHANVAKEVAFSGEFFVRKISNQDKRNRGDGDEGQQEPASADPKDYELIVDNNSGTYRPKKELLPVLQKWLQREDILGALGKVTAMDRFDETLKRWKEERQVEKRQAKGLNPRAKKRRPAGKEKQEISQNNR
jgi:hypothetical protein